MRLDGAMLKGAIGRWCFQMKAVAPELNRLDGQLGDGDLGASIEKCSTNIAAAMPDMKDDIPNIFKSCSLACAKASGSSFGTLLSIGFLTAAKSCAGHSHLDSREFGLLLAEVVSALADRGGASLGDKTVLDPLHAVAIALASAPDDADLRSIACEATRKTIDAFREKPNKVGRARMFPGKSVGIDDPGMIAFQRMVECL